MSRVNGRSHESERSGGSGALERGHVALLEPLAQLGDALGGVGAAAFSSIEAAELGVGHSATRERGVSMGADRKANIRGLVRAPSGLLQKLQRRVALEALGESSASLSGPRLLLFILRACGSRGGC